jgi:hypothetical protein
LYFSIIAVLVFQHHRVADDPRVVDEPVDLAEVLGDVVEQCLYLGFLRHIGDVALCLRRASRAALLRRGLQSRFVQVDQRQAAPGGRQPPGHGRAQSAGASRNHDCLPCEIHRVLLFVTVPSATLAALLCAAQYQKISENAYSCVVACHPQIADDRNRLD